MQCIYKLYLFDHFSIQQFQQHQQVDPTYPFLHSGFAPLRADDNLYATALTNVYQTIQAPPNQSQALINRECTACGQMYDYELEKDARGFREVFLIFGF